MRIPDWKLWCTGCRELVNEELAWDKVRPLEEYFKYYIKHRWDKKDEKSGLKETDSK